MWPERFFERFLTHRQTELHKRLPKKAGRILARADRWAEQQTKRFKLERQPFSLSEYEIEVVKTRLTELRSEQLLGRMPFLKAADAVDIEIRLLNYFQRKYQGVLQQTIEKFEIVTENEIQAIANYLENCKELAPKFVKGKSDVNQLMGICNRIRGKKPIVMVMKTGSINN